MQLVRVYVVKTEQPHRQAKPARADAMLRTFMDLAALTIGPYTHRKKLIRTLAMSAILTTGRFGIHFGAHHALQNKIDETQKNGNSIHSINNELLYPKIFGVIPVPLKTMVSRPLLTDGTVEVKLVIPDPIAETRGHAFALSSTFVTPLRPPAKRTKSLFDQFGT